MVSSYSLPYFPELKSSENFGVEKTDSMRIDVGTSSGKKVVIAGIHIYLYNNLGDRKKFLLDVFLHND